MAQTPTARLALFSARRSYEYEVDSLRLTTLVASQISQAITARFQFQSSVVGTPLETFGTVPNTLPPGVAFDIGIATGADGTPIPIRFLHFEQKRIVIDVAANSTAIGVVYDQLLEVVANAAAPAPSPIRADPIAVLEFSEVTGVLPFELSDLLAPEALDVLHAQVSPTLEGGTAVLLPATFVRPQPPGVEFSGMTSPPLDSVTFQLAPRAGSLPGQRLSYSGAPLDSTAHLRYLQSLGEAIAKRKARLGESSVSRR